MKYTPLVSVIIAVFNGEDYLARALESVRNQSYSNVELIVIDGESTDGTVDIIKQNVSYLNYWVSEKDKGIYDAWNKGLAKCNGDWISFLGADDYYELDCLSNYVSYIDQQLIQPHFVSSQVRLVDKTGAQIRIIGQPWVWGKFRKYMNATHVGSFHSREFFNEYGVFDDTFKIVGDYELLLRAGDKLKAGYLDLITVNMQTGGTSTNSNALKEAMRAKIVNRSRSRFKAKLDYFDANLRAILRRILRRP
ncbi:glycosyltransferase family 2 protein [Pedobacter sp. GR22-6]|uniref:glycosyltransferase family 2 protein n=1 Tax=Pedobacter sp. GR22-6 TaxID=3127957 RepID=UPI00307EF6A1